MNKLLLDSGGLYECSSKRITILSSCIALAATTIVMMSESTIANAFRSEGCLDLEGLTSDQEYLAGYMDAHHDFSAGFGEKTLYNPHQQTQGYLIGYHDGWSEAQHGILNSEC
jgi:hypothetical protein